MAAALQDISQRQTAAAAREEELLQLQKDAAAKSEELRQLQEDMLKSLRNQVNAFEDLTDEFQEKYKNDDTAAELRKRYEEREAALLQAVALCTTQLDLIGQTLTRDSASSGLDAEQREAWAGQLQILGEERASVLGLAGLQEIGSVGEPFDFRIHEALQRLPLPQTASGDPHTADWLNGRVAVVFEGGLLYRGSVVKKAKVAVYTGGAQNV